MAQWRSDLAAFLRALLQLAAVTAALTRILFAKDPKRRCWTSQYWTAPSHQLHLWPMGWATASHPRRAPAPRFPLAQAHGSAQVRVRTVKSGVPPRMCLGRCAHLPMTALSASISPRDRPPRSARTSAGPSVKEKEAIAREVGIGWRRERLARCVGVRWDCRSGWQRRRCGWRPGRAMAWRGIPVGCGSCGACCGFKTLAQSTSGAHWCRCVTRLIA
jgi:hypothetical protein